MFFKPFIVFLLLVGSLTVSTWAQAYLPDLKTEDLGVLDQRLKALGTTYKAEPLLALYLTAGKNPDFVAKLLEKGANPNQKSSNSLWSPLALAVMQNLSPRIVDLLLDGGANLDTRVAGASGNIIDIALDKQELQNASLLVKANQRHLKASRIAPGAQYKDYPPFFLDDLDAVRTILRNGDMPNSLVWNLALAGNSRKVLEYLMAFQIDPNFTASGSRPENTVGLDLLASNPDLLKTLLAAGLPADRVNFVKLYQKLLATKNLDGWRALKAVDPVAVRPELYRPALVLGPDIFKAVTNDLGDLTKPALFDTPGTPGSGTAALAAVLFAPGPAGEPPLLAALYEKTDFATVLPVLKANWSEPALVGLYRYAFAKKNLDLVNSLYALDAKKVRPDLYPAALDAGLDPLKALTHALADFQNPALYQDAGQANGRLNLTNLLLRPAPGRKALLETVFDKSDLPTILPILQTLDAPADLLAGKSFSASYQAWLNRDKKDITAFALARPQTKETVSGTIQGDEIAVVVGAETDVSALVAVFALSGGQAAVGGVPQVSGVTPNDFSSPASYTVTAADGSKKVYVVTVTVTPAPAEGPPVSP